MLALVLVSCGTRKGYFSLEGRFINLNQGEFYVYSNDGLLGGVDTVKVSGGRFALEIPCTRVGTLMLVFPNFTELPIFAESGGSVEIKGDASHLKQTEITGTDANELMTKFRLATATSSPPETASTAEHFIRDNASSPVALYLLRKYFIVPGKQETLNKAKELVSLILAEQKSSDADDDKNRSLFDRNPADKYSNSGNAVKADKDIRMLLMASVGNRLPAFSAKSISHGSVSSASLRGKRAIIYTWATWSYDSENMARRIEEVVNSSEGKATAIGINLCASRKECESAIERCGISSPTVCDEKMFDGDLVNRLGLRLVPGNIIVDAAGRVVARNVNADDIERLLIR